MSEVSDRSEMMPIFIGDGITTNCLLYHFFNKYPDHKVRKISSLDVIPKVDDRISILISTNGIEKGVNSLGDLLLDSFEYFVKYLSHFPGVSRAQQFHLRQDDFQSAKKFQRRFGDTSNNINSSIFKSPQFGVVLNSFVVDARIFNSSIINQFKDQIIISNKTINSIKFFDNIHIRCTDDSEFYTNQIYMGAGPFTKFLPLDFKHSALVNRHKIVSGGVWSVSVDLGDDCFVVSIDSANLIYDSKNKTIQISGKSNDKGIFQDISKPMEKNHFIFSRLIEGVPDFESGEIITSLRDKGRHRMPSVYQVKNLKNHAVSICGAYKNGYTLSPYLTSQIKF